MDLATLTRAAGPALLALPLSGRFHSHLTVRIDDPQAVERLRAFCRQRRVKLTVIDLADTAGRAQRDVMTTAYHVGRGPDALRAVLGEVAELSCALEAAGFPVLRAKLEHESLPTLPALDARRYRELHIKLALPADRFEAELDRLRAMSDGWGFVLSRNPHERRGDVVHQFLNLRRYAGTPAQADAFAAALVAALTEAAFAVVETRRETAIVDTNLGHDRWWA
ncbi:MAG: hypothetical protein H6739_28260 [Alphaproteobacteria bacterium]|nr:hypothetical protein [Alphaproteobacteria bacterium]